MEIETDRGADPAADRNADREVETRALDRYLRHPTRRRLARVVGVFQGYVWNTARRICGNEQDAEDVVQDLFLSLLLRPPRPEDVRSPRGYLAYRVLTLSLREERSRERRRKREIRAVQAAARETGSAPEGLEPDGAEALHDAIRALPERVRAAIELRYFAGLRNREIAETLGVSERTVEDDLHAGRETLRSRLGAAAFGAVALDRIHPDTAPPEGLIEGILRIVHFGSALRPALGPAIGTRVVASLTTKKALCAVAAVLLLASLGLWLAGRPSRALRNESIETTASSSPAAAPQAAPGPGVLDAGEAPPDTNEPASPAMPEPRRPVVTVTGWTVDALGAPVPQAAVKAYSTPLGGLQPQGNLDLVRFLAEGVSDESGAFGLSFEAPERSTLTLTAQAQNGRIGWSRPRVFFTLDRQVPALAPGVTIEIVAKSAPLEGTVLDADGRPIEGATVWAVVRRGPLDTCFTSETATAGPGRATTDIEGRFALDGLPGESPIDLFVEHPLYIFIRLRHVLAGVPPLEIRLERGVSLSGRIVDSDGNPVSGVTVDAKEDRLDRFGLVVPNRRFQRTDADGVFSIQGLTPGWNVISVHAPDRYLAIPDEWVRLNRSVDGHVIKLEAEAWVRGMARERSSHMRAARVSIVVRSGDTARHVATGEDGSFSCAVVLGPVECLGDEGLDLEPEEGNVFRGLAKPGETLEAGVLWFRKKDRGAEQEGGKTSAFRGIVLAPDGSPAFALLAITSINRGAPGFCDANRETVCGRDGRFAFYQAELPATLRACVPARRLRKEIVLQERPDGDLEVVLEPYEPLRIEGEVLTAMRPEGVPVGGAGIIVCRNMADWCVGVRALIADAKGRFVLENPLPDTRYQFHAVVADLHGPHAWQSARPGDTASVTVYFPQRRSTLEGTVSDSSGRPLAGIEILYDSSDDDTVRFGKVLSGPDGRFRISDLLAGNYHLFVDSRGFVQWGGSASTMDRPVEIVLDETGLVFFELLDPAGRPVSPALVWTARRDGEWGTRQVSTADGGRHTAEVPRGAKTIRIGASGSPSEAMEVDLAWPSEGDLDLGRLVLVEKRH